MNKHFLIAFTVLLLLAAPAQAMESDTVTSPRAQVTLVSDTDAVEAGKPFHLGLRFRQTPGWHIYWTNPGDAGQPPAIEQIKLPNGATSGAFEWPTPIRLAEGPEMVFAYENEVTLPFAVTPPAQISGNTFDVDVKANWLICAKSCIPEQGSFHLSLPMGTATPSSQAPLFSVSAERAPRPLPFAASVTDETTLHIEDKSLSAKSVSDAWFFPDVWGAVEHAAAQKLSFDDTGLILELKPGTMFDAKAPLTGILVLKDISGHESYYSVSAPRAAVHGEQVDLLQMLFFALLGGLILNLMPCVFPILAMKALSIAKLSGAARHHVREQAIFYTLGILTAFTAIDAVLLALRTAGQAVGWGIQFQSPVFVTAMAWLLFVLGLNLSGVYTIGSRLMGIGESYSGRKGATGSFFTGLLAVVVATPCVAPYVGVAIGAALTATPIAMLGIFLAMGIGLALPYVALALFPDAVRVLPKPGRWMEILRQAMAFPMYAASAWLLWVLSKQAGDDGLAIALAGALLLSIAAWLHGEVHAHHARPRRITHFLTAAALVATAALLIQIGELAPVTSHGESLATNEEPYSEKRLAELRAAGKPVFVNMTAAWCITCLVNEKVAISTDAVRDSFERNHVTYLKGDWTQQAPSITRFLQDHGRDGVPLYVYFPANDDAPVLLPQILTAPMILSAIDHSHS